MCVCVHVLTVNGCRQLLSLSICLIPLASTIKNNEYDLWDTWTGLKNYCTQGVNRNIRPVGILSALSCPYHRKHNNYKSRKVLRIKYFIIDIFSGFLKFALLQFRLFTVNFIYHVRVCNTLLLCSNYHKYIVKLQGEKIKTSRCFWWWKQYIFEILWTRPLKVILNLCNCNLLK